MERIIYTRVMIAESMRNNGGIVNPSTTVLPFISLDMNPNSPAEKRRHSLGVRWCDEADLPSFGRKIMEMKASQPIPDRNGLARNVTEYILFIDISGQNESWPTHSGPEWVGQKCHRIYTIHRHLWPNFELWRLKKISSYIKDELSIHNISGGWNYVNTVNYE